MAAATRPTQQARKIGRSAVFRNGSAAVMAAPVLPAMFLLAGHDFVTYSFDRQTEAAVNTDLIRQERARIIEEHGRWTDHNIHLADGIYTMDSAVASDKLRRVLQIVSDLARKPIAELRVLDLACLEGQYAIELARHGARTVAIEGRRTNIEKARFAQRTLGLGNLELIHGDVRDLSRARHGGFDVVLCLGILYHLDAPDVFTFIESIADACDDFAIFDTFVSLEPRQSYPFKGRTFWGRDFKEHAREDSESEKLSKLWSSLDNPKSVWLTKATLLNLLSQSGFTSVFECEVPVELDKYLDRVTLVAIKGRPVEVRNNPLSKEALPEQLPEGLVRKPCHYQSASSEAINRISQLVPRALRQQAKQLLRSVGVIKRPAATWEHDDRFRW